MTTYRSASEIPEYRLPADAVRWEVEQMVRHGRGGVRVQYGRRLGVGDLTLKVSSIVLLVGV